MTPNLILRRYISLILVFSGLFLSRGYAQTVHIQGTINHYASIETILASDDNDVDSVVVTSLPSAFKDGDTVMIYCVQGAEIELTDIFGEDDIGRDAQNPRNTGKYAFLIIDQIDGNTVVFNSSVNPEIGPMGPGEVAQLIRVPSYHRAEVDAAGVSAQDWNGTTGGVVAMFVRTALELNGNIDVSGRGFRGAAASTPYYGGDCSSADPTLYDSAFYTIDNIRAGVKGEGTTDTRFSPVRGNLMRGKARNINGGGGGNAKFSGGGGGSNFSSGGAGGNESSQCAPGVESPGGVGGFDLGRGDAYYINGTSLNRENRIFFGGGGGTGTVMSGRTTTSGADGGGIVIIIADTIIGNGHRIRSDGNSVTLNATGAGGGGGGGGAIMLDVSGYKSNLLLSAAGGDGGNTNYPADTTGPGGGGGGGIYWLAGTDEPGVNPDEDGFGRSGKYLSATDIQFGAANGAPPARKDGLKAPLRGFLFNTVPTEFWVCSDQVPETIMASKPKGGSGSYTYTWVDSSSTQNQWQTIPGATGQHLSFLTPVADTTYYRRIVKEVPAILPADTSFRIALYVHHAITGNIISAPDTVCKGNAPELPFSPVGSPGSGLGPGSYTYLWQKAEGGGNYTDADGPNAGAGYQAPPLNVTTRFSRITYSGVCADTSAALIVTVFEPIANNTISDNDTICLNTQPDLITGLVITGGDPSDKRYRWESGPAGTGPWSEEAGGSMKDYQPDVQSATIWFRRVALSGNDDACVDYSEPVEILNIPVITGNTILTADQTVCTGDQPQLMAGSAPGGGYMGVYRYSWESRTGLTGWQAADNTNGNNLQGYTPPVMSGDTTIYRRIVSSGGVEGVCKDTSGTGVINVLPSITNNVISTEVTMNCQFDNLALLTGSEPGGGATEGGVDPTRNYRWEEATGSATPGSWSEISYGADKKDYTDSPELSLTDDYWFRRVVLSGPSTGGENQVCSDVSDPLHITIHTAISGNDIDGADSACFNTEKALQGETPVGESGLTPSYSWRDAVSGEVLGSTRELPYTFTSLEARLFRRIVEIGECEDTSGIMAITVMELPGGTLSGDLPMACEKDVLLDIDLDMEELTLYLTPWEISLSDGVNPGLLEPQLLDGDGTVEVSLGTDEVSTQYDYTIGKMVYRLTDGTECIAPPEKLTGHVPIEVFLTPDPVITVTTELIDNAVCDNGVSMVVDPDHGTGLWSSSFSDDLGFIPDPEALTVRASIDPNDAGAWDNLPYTIYFTSEAGDCFGIDSVEISFFEQPEPANAGVDDTVYLSNSTWLDADPATSGEGSWTVISGNGVFEDLHDPKTYVYDLAKGEKNEFRWTIVNGVCESSDDWAVISQDEAKRYEGFSPNGDQINDYFIIRGLKEQTEPHQNHITFSISFFNALGKTVRTLTDETVGEIDYDPAMIPNFDEHEEVVIWDGISANGNPVPAGTYYYVLNIVIDQVDAEGNVTGTDKPVVKDYIVVRD